MSTSVDKQLFAELAEKEVQNVEFPPVCTYDHAEKRYVVTAWGKTYSVFLEQKQIVTPSVGFGEDMFSVFLINYLLLNNQFDPTGEWISEKDFTGGVTFFRGPHTIPTSLISSVYKNDLNALTEKCLLWGGMKGDMADISFSFDILGPVKVALLYWQGDEDFPAEAKILVDSGLKNRCNLDVIYALLCDVCLRISAR